MEPLVDPLKPLQSLDGVPVFDEAWQAEALAIADSLIQAGLFSASAWSDTLGQTLKEAESRGEPDNQQTYYNAVLVTLEKIISANSDIDRNALNDMRRRWENAYRSTEHGQPVALK